MSKLLRARLVASVSLALAFTACASLTPAGEKVELFRYRASAEFMATEDRIKKTCKFLSEKRWGDQGGTDTRNVARNYAATIGADTILWWEYSSNNESRSEFYLCKQAP
jgi:hypothetical protein